MSMNTINLKQIIFFVLGFFVGIVGLYSWSHFFSDTKDEEALESVTKSSLEADLTPQHNVSVGNDSATTISPLSVQSDAVVVASQGAGDSVLVKSVDLDSKYDSGWVVVHELNGGVIANALGATRVDPGKSENVKVYLLRGTEHNKNYVVVLYKDNGDKEFSLKTDEPISNANKELVMSSFLAK